MGVVVAYTDDLGPSEASAVLDLDNQGDSGNLLPDPGFESCPVGNIPTGWVWTLATGDGDWECVESWSNFQPHGGNRMLASGYGPFGKGGFRLSHIVDLTILNNSRHVIDRVGARLLLVGCTDVRAADHVAEDVSDPAEASARRSVMRRSSLSFSRRSVDAAEAG